MILQRFIVTRNHWEMFPHNREVPDKLLKELMGIMIHAGLGELWLPATDPQSLALPAFQMT